MDKDLSRFHPYLPEKFGFETEEKATPQPQILLPTPNELVNLLSKRVIGHEQAKRTLAVAVYQHLMQCAHTEMKGKGRVEAENHVLLAGQSGSGKSLLLRELGEILKIPIFYISCSQLVPVGYKGKDVTDFIAKMARTLVDGEFTHPAIAIWDEVDKLSMYSGSDESESGAGIYMKMVQTNLLTYLDGSKCGPNDSMDSSKILNIACGAFVGLDGIRNPKSPAVVGFHAKTTEDSPCLQPIKPEHLTKFGLIPEFVGRFSRIVALDPLDRGVMRRILTDAEGNVLARRKEFFALHGVILEFDDGAIDVMIDQAMNHETGARALRLVVDQMLRTIEHRLPEMTAEGITAIIINRDVAIGKLRPLEHKGKPEDRSPLLQLRHTAAYTNRLKPQTDVDDDELSCF